MRSLPVADPGWAPLTYTFAGIWEMQPHALEEYDGPVQILDVASPTSSPARSDIFPAPSSYRWASWRRARANWCATADGRGVPRRSRSAQAVDILVQAGFADVANLGGGMLRWRAEGHPIAGGSA